MEKLTNREFHDISEHACERIGQIIGDAFQLIEHPQQRAAMGFNFAKAMMIVAADLAAIAFTEQHGKRVPRHVAMFGVLKQIMENEGIEFREVDRL
jgi:hypothetical protein